MNRFSRENLDDGSKREAEGVLDYFARRKREELLKDVAAIRVSGLGIPMEEIADVLEFLVSEVCK